MDMSGQYSILLILCVAVIVVNVVVLIRFRRKLKEIRDKVDKGQVGG